MALPRNFRTFAGASLFLAMASGAQLDDATRSLSRGIFRQLIEINTTDSVGSTTVAAEAMRQRLLDAGVDPADGQVLGPNDRKGNPVARLHRTGAPRPTPGFSDPTTERETW